MRRTTIRVSNAFLEHDLGSLRVAGSDNMHAIAERRNDQFQIGIDGMRPVPKHGAQFVLAVLATGGQTRQRNVQLRLQILSDRLDQ
jgi:hypothetical protein